MAWRILLKEDHLYGETYDPPEETVFMYDSVEDRVAGKHIEFPYSRAFKAYDDDGTLYFSGRLEWDDNSGGAVIPGAKYDGPDEDTLCDVHRHFEGGWGVTAVKYHGKPSWTIG